MIQILVSAFQQSALFDQTFGKAKSEPFSTSWSSYLFGEFLHLFYFKM